MTVLKRVCARVGLGVLVIHAVAPAASGQQPGPPAPAASSATLGLDQSQGETLRLRERTAAFWAARVSRDFRAQWELLEPRVKGRVSADEYASGRGALRYLGYEVGEATIDGAFATVKVRVIAQLPPIGGPAQRPMLHAGLVEDRWIKVDGVWYRSQDQDRGEQQSPR